MDDIEVRKEQFRVEYIELCNRTGIALDYDTIGLADKFIDLRASNSRMTDDFGLADNAERYDRQYIGLEYVGVEAL